MAKLEDVARATMGCADDRPAAGPAVILFGEATMALDVAKLRKLVALDENDPLSRFALGSKLFETDPSHEALEEAAHHLHFANAKSPEHLATYHILGQVLTKLGRHDQARQVYEAGIARAQAVGEGMGRDLAPAMRELLAGLPR